MKEKENNIKIVNLWTRQEIDQFAEYLKAFIDNWCSISFSSTFSHMKIKEDQKNWNQMIWLWTFIESEKVDDIVEYIVLSFTRNNHWEEVNVLDWLQENTSI